MVVFSRTLPRDLRIVSNDLPDDTEESIVGIEWHQEAAGALAAALASVAARRGAGWGVCEEVGLAGLHHLDGRPYSPRPDVFVLDGPITGRTAEVALAEVGPPLLVIEIASESTWRNDVGDKRAAYEGAGVAEYVVFDPAGDYIAERVRAWRRNAKGRFEVWQKVGDAWESVVLDLSFFVEGPLLRVRDHDGWTPSLGRLAPLRELVAQTRATEAEEQARRAEEQARRAEEQARQEAAARRQAEEQVQQEATARRQAEEQRRQAEEELHRLAARLQAMEEAVRRGQDRPPEDNATAG